MKINDLALHASLLLIFLWDIFDSILPNGSLVAITIAFLCFCISNQGKIVINKIFILIVTFFIVHLIINMIAKNANMTDGIKQLVGISFCYLYYDNIVIKYGYNNAFRLYFKYAIFFSCFGLVQFLFKNMGLHFLSDLTYIMDDYFYDKGRICWLYREPSFVAFTLIPAVFVAINILTNSSNFSIIIKDNYRVKVYAIIIIVCYLLTLSSVGYLGFCIALIYVYRNRIFSFKFLIAFLVACMFLVIAYNNISLFRERVYDLFSMFFTNSVESDANLSSYALYSNMEVTRNSLFESKGLGNGIGSYYKTYKNIAPKVLNINQYGYGTNAKDGNSLLFRIITELGIPGILVVIYILKPSKKYNKSPTIIYYACLMTILLRLIRQGHYFHAGFFFFVVCLIYDKKCKSNRVVLEID